MLSYRIENSTSRPKLRDGFLRHYQKDIGLDPVHTEAVSLLDLLPDFMSISANSIIRNQVQAYVGPWVELAAELCVVAALEQYILFGVEDDRPRREAFAWGYIDEAKSNSDTDSRAVNDMFTLFNTTMPMEWETMRDQSSAMVSLLE